MNFSVKIKWHVLRARLYMERLRGKNFLFPIVVFVSTVFFFVFYFSFNQITNYWVGWHPAGGNSLHFCEQNRWDSLIRQPSNTWSNLGFFVVGLFTLTLGVQDLKFKNRKESDNFLVRYPVFSILFSAAVLYLFIGSFFYHASLTKTFQALDQTGMYAVVSMVIVFNLYKIFPLVRIGGNYKSTHAWWVLLAVILNYFLYATLFKININMLFPLLITVAFLTSAYYLMFISREHYFTNYMWAAFVILVLAAVIWILDRTSVVCSPESVLQGHALWHLFCAASILFIYLYYRSGTAPLGERLEVMLARRERRIERRMQRKNGNL